MKTLLYILLFFGTLSSCTTNNSTDKAINLEETVSLGGTKDKHGCLVAAGQTWSQLKKECIQVFSTGKRLDPVDINLGDAVISAFVLLSTDESQLELFLPDIEDTILLPKTTSGDYQNEIYRYDPAKSTLYINEELTYEATK